MITTMHSDQNASPPRVEVIVRRQTTQLDPDPQRPPTIAAAIDQSLPAALQAVSGVCVRVPRKASGAAGELQAPVPPWQWKTKKPAAYQYAQADEQWPVTLLPRALRVAHIPHGYRVFLGWLVDWWHRQAASWLLPSMRGQPRPWLFLVREECAARSEELKELAIQAMF